MNIRDIVAPPANEKPMAKDSFLKKQKKSEFIPSNITKWNFYMLTYKHTYIFWG